MNLSRSFPSSLTYLKQKKAGQKNHFSKKQTIVCFFYFFLYFYGNINQQFHYSPKIRNYHPIHD